MLNAPATVSHLAPSDRPWWERRPFVAALILLSAVPLLYPDIPPLVDLYGHLGRYRVQLDLDSSQWLPLYYDFDWAAIGNLGVDLLIIPLAPIFGLELAVKLIVLSIPPMTVAGFLWVAREVHHRLPPTVLFALPFAYSHPLLFGFANFALSIALAFLAFGLWLHLAAKGRLRLRAMLFVPISIVIFFAHTYGWGVLGLLCFSAEAVRQHDRGKGWLRSGVNAALHATVMALPLLIMIAWRTDTHGTATFGWFEWELKRRWLETVLRDRWPVFDQGSLIFLGLVLLFAVVSRKLSFSRNLFFSGLVLLAGFILLPKMIFASAYADMRLLPYVIAVFLLAIRFRGEMQLPLGRVLALLGLVFYLVRIAGHTLSFAMAADDQRSKLEAIEHLPMGARVASLVGQPCGWAWDMARNSHLGAMVIVRRHGFSNDQWLTEGMNLLDLRYRDAGLFRADPSQLVKAPSCRRSWTIDMALTALPRGAFDYVWMIDAPAPADPRLLDGLELVWEGRGSRLFRISPAAAEPQAATHRTEAASAR